MTATEIVFLGTLTPWAARAVIAAVAIIVTGALAGLAAAARLIWKGFRDLPLF